MNHHIDKGGDGVGRKGEEVEKNGQEAHLEILLGEDMMLVVDPITSIFTLILLTTGTVPVRAAVLKQVCGGHSLFCASSMKRNVSFQSFILFARTGVGFQIDKGGLERMEG